MVITGWRVGWTHTSDPDDPERHDVKRALEEAALALGGGQIAIASLVPMTTAETLWRYVQKRFAEQDGAVRAGRTHGGEPLKRPRGGRGTGRKPQGAVWAQRVVHHFFACMDWLRSRGHLLDGACMRPKDWKKQFRNDWRKLTGQDIDEEREGPRYSPEEAGRLLDGFADERVDPRLRTNLYCGGDSLRSGQVRRAMRTALDLSDTGEFGRGRVEVKGRGKQRWSYVDLDPAARAHFDYVLSEGYLRECEAAFRSGRITDYALMPQGRFVRGAIPVRRDGKYMRPISRRTLLTFSTGWRQSPGQAPGRARVVRPPPAVDGPQPEARPD